MKKLLLDTYGLSAWLAMMAFKLQILGEKALTRSTLKTEMSSKSRQKQKRKKRVK